MSDSHDVSYLQANERSVTSKFPDPSEIAPIYQASRQILQKNLQIAFDIVDDTLFDLASGTQSSGEQNHFFDAMRDVRLKRKSIQQEFLKSIQESFEPTQIFSGTPADSGDTKAPILIENENAEFLVALEAMESKASLRFKQEISAAQTGIAELYNAKTRSSIKNPFSPQNICKAFHSACRALELNVRSYLLVLKIFDKQVMGNLGQVFTQLSQDLENLGIVTTNTETTKPTNVNQVSEDEIVIELDSSVSVPILTRRIQAESISTKSNQEIVNLVGQLFDFIYKDYELSRPVQGILSRLQIIYLEIIFADQKTFFASDKHPARALLNSMAEAGKHWSSEHPHGDILLAKLESIANRAKHDFTGDITLFISLSRELQSFMTKFEQSFGEISYASTRRNEQPIRAEVSQMVSTLLDQASDTIPPDIIDFLESDWSRALINTRANPNSEPSTWSKYVEITQQLVWCSQIPNSKEIRRQWVQVVPRLLKEISKALLDCGQNETHASNTVSHIKEVLTNQFKNSHLERRPLKSKEDASPAKIEQTDSIANSIDKLQPFLKTVDSLEIGQWAEFRLENGSVHRCKLQSYDEQTDKLTFVNRLGTKPIEKSRLEIAKDIEKKRVIFIDEDLVVDRALDKIMQENKKNP